MTIMNYCIQCKDIRSGKIGTFAYDESKTPEGNVGFHAISPVFADLVQFYAWAHANGFYAIPGVLEPVMSPVREQCAEFVSALKAVAI